jgi:bacterioferritin-associated ferredoxin
MIVCSCNALSEARIKTVLQGDTPPRRVLAVHHCLGTRPQCGSCARTILGLIRDSQGDRQGALACLDDDVAA